MPSASTLATAVVTQPHFLDQQYINNEGIHVVSKLPHSIRQHLCYYETVGVTKPFKPLPPLSGSPLAAQSYVAVAVTDWSLYVLTNSNSRQDAHGVLLEIPWLWVKDLGVEAVDSDTVLQPIEGKRFKASVITLLPQVDVHKLPPAQKQQLERVAQALAAGASPDAAQAAARGQPWYKRLFSKPQPAATSDGVAATAIAVPPTTSAAGNPAAPAAAAGTPWAAGHAQWAVQPSHNQLQQPQQQDWQAGTAAWVQACVPATAQAGSAAWSAQGSTARPLGESIEQVAMRPPAQAAPASNVWTAPAAQHRASSTVPACHAGTQPGWLTPGLHMHHPQAGQPYGPQAQPACGPGAQQQLYGQQQPYCQPPPGPQQYGQQQLWQQGYGMGCQQASPHVSAHAAITASAAAIATRAPSNHVPPRWDQGVQGPPSPSVAWAARGGGPTPWAPLTRLPPPPPLDMRAPVLPAVPQPLPEEQWGDEAGSVEAADIVLGQYMLALITVEPRSRLAHHMRRAWLTAHTRLAAACSGTPGVPTWFAPPSVHTAWLRPATHSLATLTPLQPGIPPEALHQAVLQHLGFSSPGEAAWCPDVLQRLFPGRALPARTAAAWPKSLLLHSCSTTCMRMHAQPGAALPAPSHTPGTALLESLVQQLAASTQQRQLSPAQVREAFQLAELRLQAGCSLWDDDDERTLQELLLAWGLSSCATARSLGSAFFTSRTALAFITSRLMAWGALCTMYGPDLQQAAVKQAVTPYVQWVLSRNRDLTGHQGHLLGQVEAAPRSPWGSAAGSPSPGPHSAWDSPSYEPCATPQPAPQSPARNSRRSGVMAPGICQVQQAASTTEDSSEFWAPGQRAAPHAGLANHRPLQLPLPCEAAGAGCSRTSIEEDYAFFLQLYNMRNWQGLDAGGSGNRRPQHVLRMLGLARGCAPSVWHTYTSICRLIDSCRHASPDPGRSQPPPVQAPPSLGPADPLSLSPMQEEPYLFAVSMAGPATPAAWAACTPTQQQGPASSMHMPQAQQTAGASHSGYVRPGGSSSANPRWSGLDSSQRNAVEQAVGIAQERQQGRLVGRTLQRHFMEEVYGERTSAPEHCTRAQARWARLVGRLAARVAWRKLQLLLRWLSAMLGTSQGCATSSAVWMSDQVLEVVPAPAPSPGHPAPAAGAGAITFRTCTCLLAALLPQLADPAGPPPSQQQVPRSPTDQLWWCQQEASSSPGSWQDHVACCSWVLSGLSEAEAAGCRRPAGEPDLVVQAVRQLPLPMAHAYCRRLLCRMVALASGVAGPSAALPANSSSCDAAAGAACAVAVQLGELLLLLLGKLPGAAASLHDSLGHRLLLTLRTPQVSCALSRTSTSAGPVLGPLVVAQLQEVAAQLAAAHPGTRPASLHQPGLSQSQLVNLGSWVGRHKLPGVLT